MKKKIVCFANSRKPGGKCFAGKDIYDKSWIRPVSSRENDSLNNVEICIRGNNCNCKFCNPIMPRLLDIIEIEISDYLGIEYQVENYLVGDDKWRKIGTLRNEYIDEFLDHDYSDLWIVGYQAYNRKNDKIPISKSNLISNSLRLIEINSLDLHVVLEGEGYGNPRKKVNGRFMYNNQEYMIPVTDCVIESQYLSRDYGIYRYGLGEERIILCLSIGKEFNGYIYKFIAGIIKI